MLAWRVESRGIDMPYSAASLGEGWRGRGDAGCWGGETRGQPGPKHRGKDTRREFVQEVLEEFESKAQPGLGPTLGPWG